jgi:hypothetical protein
MSERERYGYQVLTRTPAQIAAGDEPDLVDCPLRAWSAEEATQWAAKVSLPPGSEIRVERRTVSPWEPLDGFTVGADGIARPS